MSNEKETQDENEVTESSKHFLYSYKTLPAAEVRKFLQKFFPLELKKFNLPKNVELPIKEKYVIGIFGPQKAGKSTLINFLLACWRDNDEVTIEAPVGTAEKSGTYRMTGPYRLCSGDRLRDIFHLYDTVGFFYLENKIQSGFDMAIKTCRGKIKPGDVQFTSSSNFQYKLGAEKDYEGLDAVILYLDGESELAASTALNVYNQLYNQNFIPTLVIFRTCVPEEFAQKNKATIPHICLTPPQVGEKINDEQKRAGYNVLCEILSRLEHKPLNVVPVTGVSHDFKEMQKGFAETWRTAKPMMPSFSNMIIGILVLIVAVLFYKTYFAKAVLVL